MTFFSGEKRLNDPINNLDGLKEPAAKKKKIKNNNKKNRKSSAF